MSFWRLFGNHWLTKVTWEMAVKTLTRVCVMLTGAVEWSRSLSHDPVSVNCVRFTSDSKRVVAGMANGSVTVCVIHRVTQWMSEQCLASQSSYESF